MFRGLKNYSKLYIRPWRKRLVIWHQQNQLTVTGAIISKNRPDFHRTHGADKNDPTDPSEIFHYTPNLYLTPYNLTQTGPKPHWTLTDLKQLPARL